MAKAAREAKAEAGGGPAPVQPIRRRDLLSASGLLLAGGTLLGLGLQRSAAAMDMAIAMAGSSGTRPFDPQASLRSFERGRVVENGGRRVRVFEVEARSITLPLGGGGCCSRPGRSTAGTPDPP